MINIKRIRFVVVRTTDNSIFCGLARNYEFKKISELKDTPLKTYLSEKKAKSSFLLSWRGAEEDQFKTGYYKIVKISEEIKEVIDYE